jgi:hypothetical protein
MVNKYKLVNPYIKGEFESKIDASNSLEAAKTFYKNLSEHFSNNVPKYYFTVQKGGSGKGKFYHFEVKEHKNEDEVKYSIKPYKLKNEDKATEQFIENFDKFKGRFNGKGGAKKGRKSKPKRRSSKRDSDSESSDSYDYYRESKSYVATSSQPFYYMYYDPLVYQLDYVYLPTWNAYVTPYTQLATYGYGLLY